MKLARFLLMVCVAAVGSRSQAQGAEGSERVYFGTYGNGPGEGIFVAELNLASSVVSPPRLAAEAVDPSFLAIAPSHKYLYAVSEVSTLGGQKTGGVVAFAVDQATGRLTRLNEQASHGAGPSHLVVDKTGTNVLVANYEGGSAAVLPILEGGRLRSASSWTEFHCHGPNAERQEKSHAHSINLDPANRFAFVADLGCDAIHINRFDAATGSLRNNKPSSASLPPGSGPRHLAFHPTGRFVYVANELASTVNVFWYDADAGSLSSVQTISTLPPAFKETNTVSEVVVHSSGKFVYVANRGHDSIAIFNVDVVTGRLTAAGHESTQGKTPRNFNIDPTGTFLLAANQDSDSVVVFRLDPATGKLKATGQTVKIRKPVCVRF
jgi:6-phosphogluconolactonase